MNHHMALGANAKLDLLKHAPLFEQCSKHELHQIAQIADELDLSEGKVRFRIAAGQTYYSLCRRYGFRFEIHPEISLHQFLLVDARPRFVLFNQGTIRGNRLIREL